MTDVFSLIQEVAGKRNARMRVLLHFLRKTSAVTYPAELAGHLRLPEVSVRRALTSLAERKFLVSQPTRYRHYFRRR